MNEPMYVDFNNSDALGRVRLNSAGTIRDLSRLGLTLAEGLVTQVSDRELVFTATVTWSTEEDAWVVVLGEELGVAID